VSEIISVDSGEPRACIVDINEANSKGTIQTHIKTAPDGQGKSGGLPMLSEQIPVIVRILPGEQTVEYLPLFYWVYIFLGDLLPPKPEMSMWVPPSNSMNSPLRAQSKVKRVTAPVPG
jgi:hypothetical protein